MTLLKKFYEPFYLFLGLVVALYCMFILFYSGISFDGAIHSSLGLNLWTSGKYTLDFYPMGMEPQIKLPFQAVHGFYLKFFGRNFLASNLANLTFLIFFILLTLKIMKLNNTRIFLFSIFLSMFSYGMLNFGFQAYGELPAFVFSFIGLYFLIFKDRKKHFFIFLSAFFISTAIATKWVMTLSLFPVGLILLIELINRNYKSVIIWVCMFLLVFLSYNSFERASLGINLITSLKNTASQSISINHPYYYSGYFERMGLFWKEYMMGSLTPISAILKILLLILMLLYSIKIFKETNLIDGIKKRNIQIDQKKLFSIVFTFYTIIYFLWWLFLEAKPWYRRFFITDVLLFLSVANFYSINKMAWKRIVIVCFFLLCIYQVLPSVNKIILPKFKSKVTAITLETKLSAALNNLPENYIGYGYWWWSAARWSLLSNKKFYDLNTSGLIKLNDGLGDGGNYLFLEPEVDTGSKKAIFSRNYIYKKIFSYNGYEIYKIDSK